MYVMPEPNSVWRRRKDDRLDRVAGGGGSRYVLMYSPDTGKHWHIEINGFNRRYEPATDAETATAGALPAAPSMCQWPTGTAGSGPSTDGRQAKYRLDRPYIPGVELVCGVHARSAAKRRHPSTPLTND